MIHWRPRPAAPAGRRLYVVGGGGGDLARLDARLAAVAADAGDAVATLVIAGGLAGPGIDAPACILRAMRPGDAFAETIVVAGDAERAMLHALEGDRAAMRWWLERGGDWALAGYGADRGVIAGGDPGACIAAARAVVPSVVHHWLLRRPSRLALGDYVVTGEGLSAGQRHWADGAIGLSGTERWTVAA